MNNLVLPRLPGVFGIFSETAKNKINVDYQ